MTQKALVDDIRTRWSQAASSSPGTQIHVWADGSADLFVGRPQSESGYSLLWADLPAPFVTAMSCAPRDVEVLLAIVDHQAQQLAHDLEVRLHQERG